MKFNKTKVASACVPLLLSVTTVNAQPVPGGSLDPLSIPKYVTPLVIPPPLYDDNGSPMEVEMALRQITQQILPEGFPVTTLWGYGDPDRPNTFFNPAFTFEVTKDTLTTVTWINQLVKDPEECFDDGDDDDDRGHHGDHGDKRGGDDRVSRGRSRYDDDKNSRSRYADNKNGRGRGDDGHHGDDDNGHHGKGAGRKPECNFLPHIITDAAGNPVVDQTLHWAAPNQDCADGIPRTDCAGASDQPYTGPIPMVTHVHGAHVGPISDGYPEAWWLPDANDIPAGYATQGTFYDDINGGAPGTGSATYQYTNDQPTSTLWFHDHSLGMTRLNVYAAGAGFWLIRNSDGSESGLAEGQSLPGPGPVLGSNPNTPGADRDSVREIPIGIQPKSFNLDGSQYYPADRQFFEGLGDGQSFGLNDNMSSLVTADGTFPFLPPQNGSDIAPVWNPEAFFNTMVVNGRTWPQLEVASERYRFRLLNASDSRFLNLALFEVVDAGGDGVMGTADDSLGAEIPFYQIGSEQGLLPNVVRIETGFATPLPGDGTDVGTGVTPIAGSDPQQALLMGPAERHDVIVDFSNLPDGAIIRMINTAPDAPFGGFPDVPADSSTTGQVIQFMVNMSINKASGDSSTPVADLTLDPKPGGAPKLGASSVTRDLALLEEESALLCVEVDAATGAITHVTGDPTVGCPAGSDPFAPMAAVLGVNGSQGGTAQLWDDPISTNPALNAVETWELWNRSADAHPIHLHLVKFEVVNREGILTGAVRGPEPWETGWKDTVIAYPDEITRVKAQFDIPGLYVWHCHILSHEDNEMMVPYCVGDPANCTPPVQ